LKNIIISGLICSFVLLGASKEVEQPYYAITKIVIDAGHGGHDPGTSGSISKEKDVALAVSRQLGRILKEHMPNVEVIFTRPDDNFIGLKERADVANKNDAELFVSLHCNAEAGGHTALGTETWVMGIHRNQSNLEVAMRENSVILMEDDYEKKYDFDPQSPESYILFSLYQNAYLEQSLDLANRVQDQFKERVGRKSRGVKQAGLVVLYQSSMPSILIELGFLSNPKEERYLNDDLGQVYMASAIFRAIRDYKNDLESSE